MTPQKISAAAFKNKFYNFFFECPGKMFLSIEKVLEKIIEDQP